STDALARSLSFRAVPPAMADGGDGDGCRDDGGAGEPLLLPAAIGGRLQAALHQPGARVPHGYRPNSGVGRQFLESLVARNGARSRAARGYRPSIRVAVASRVAPRSTAHGRRTGNVAGEGDDQPRGIARRSAVPRCFSDAGAGAGAAGSPRVRGVQGGVAVGLRRSLSWPARAASALAHLLRSVEVCGSERRRGRLVRSAISGRPMGGGDALLRGHVRVVLDRHDTRVAGATVPSVGLSRFPAELEPPSGRW